ncbi:MAG: hypothetical protein HYX79_07420 [Chloroflexi bacterium]|nr:hypothetical protein [Chloroflexota bacterium]
MPEELGRIEKPEAEEFKRGRKLYFVPLLYSGPDLPADYLEKCARYWKEVEDHVSGLEVKIGQAVVLYYELVTEVGEEGRKAIEQLDAGSYEVVRRRLDKGARLNPVEERDLLTELMDWSKCLSVGLQNEQVLTAVYTHYVEASKKRNEHIAKQIDETLIPGKAGILFMREGHQVQFPADIQVFYVAPPSLDELKRWLRDRQSAPQQEKKAENEENHD